MLTVICGPPCGGKSTLAQLVRGPHQLLLDFDLLAKALGARDRFYDNAFRQRVYTCWLSIQQAILFGRDGVIVHGMPSMRDIDRYMAGGAHFTICDPGMETVIKRLVHRPAEHRQFADKFYHGYGDQLSEALHGYEYVRRCG